MGEKTTADLDLIKMGQRIRDRREELKMTRDYLASRLGVSNRFLADVECGHKGISIQNLYGLSQILNFSIDYIMTGGLEASEENSEADEIKANIMEILKKCNDGQLRCFEGVAKYYVAALKEE